MTANSIMCRCQPAKAYTVPRGQPCVYMLEKVVSACKIRLIHQRIQVSGLIGSIGSLEGPTFGGKVEDESNYGCLEWWVYASGSQI